MCSCPHQLPSYIHQESLPKLVHLRPEYGEVIPMEKFQVGTTPSSLKIYRCCGDVEYRTPVNTRLANIKGQLRTRAWLWLYLFDDYAIQIYTAIA